MFNDEAKQLYSMRLAEKLWERIVVDIPNSDLQSVDEGKKTLNKTQFESIVEFFGGKFYCFEPEDDMVNEETAMLQMQEYLRIGYNGETVKGNSYFVKTDDNGHFEIGCFKYNIIDCAHELGHAFLDMGHVVVNKVLWSSSVQSESEYLVDTFSRSFIMPRDRFLRTVARYSDRNKCDITNVATAFGVEYMDAFIRGKELNSWD